MAFAEHFRDRVCVVTGAASGIGLALGEELLRAGAYVHLADLDAAALASAVQRLGPLARRARSTAVDVTSQQQVQGLIDGAVAGDGRLDFLFNNAGVGGTLPAPTASLDDWRRIIDLNLWGVIYGVHAALPIMLRQRAGHIVNTASVAGLVPLPFQALYCTTKFAVVGLSESLRYELAEEGIKVSVACPGNVATPIWSKRISGEATEGSAPADSITAEACARSILAGLVEGDGINVMPEPVRQWWLGYRASSAAVETMLHDLARQRRQAFLQAKGAGS